MKKQVLLLLMTVIFALNIHAQLPKVYNENINQMTQIDEAISKAKQANKFVVCQLGGNRCPWCLRFADFITKDAAISKIIADNYVYIHVNYHPRKSAPEGMLKRLGYPQRFGFPVFVILNGDGKVVHIQDSSLLEEGQGYSPKKVLSFFKHWTPNAVAGKAE